MFRNQSMRYRSLIKNIYEERKRKEGKKEEGRNLNTEINVFVQNFLGNLLHLQYCGEKNI